MTTSSNTVVLVKGRTTTRISSLGLLMLFLLSGRCTIISSLRPVTALLSPMTSTRSRSFRTTTTVATTTKLWDQQPQKDNGGGRVSTSVQDSKLLEKSSNKSKSKKSKSQSPKSQLETNPVKGTRDFYPEDLKLRTWLFAHWRTVAQQYGFVEYDAPVLESEALYTRKAGEDVTQQLYSFEDKGQRRVALRPEMTPSLARMVMAKKGGLPLPLKWYSIPQCWRYERMTRGRRREHYQWNMDMWGIDSEVAEAELLSAMVTFFQAVGLTHQDVAIKINSRLVITEILTKLGVPDSKFAATCVLVDKLEKVPLDALQQDMEDIGLERSVVEQLTTLIAVDSIDDIRKVLGDESPAVQQIQTLLKLCQSYGLEDWIVFDASIVRGLSYYTEVVFEAVDRTGTLRAIAGGGRYDQLLETFGGAPTPACGFGFGDAVILELLKDRHLLPTLDVSGIDTVVFAMSSGDEEADDYHAKAIQVASTLRAAGQNVELVLDKSKKMKWVFKHADRLHAKYCAVIGSEEFTNGEVAMKNLQNGAQTKIPITDLASWVVEEDKNKKETTE
mmetsp:Transcript_736/g.801  ORF Transcript_736/g.801 Transcript_736/m.801 type:complete len:558 (+) Transcript_736:276-1949(+)